MSKLVKPKNNLKNKVGEGGFRGKDVVMAQRAIEQNKVDFVPIAHEFLKEIEDILVSIKSTRDGIEGFLSSLLDPLMKLRAQGSLFHYPSITHISDVVVDFLDTEKCIDDDIVEILAVYRKAGHALLSLKIKDDKDKTCLALIKELRLVCERYQQKHKK